MKKKAIAVAPSEWVIMEELWQAPQTLMELVRTLSASEGWAKSTITTMIRRLEEKGLIRYETDGRTKTFYPAVAREDVVAKETESLLRRAYNGSIGLMVSAMAQRNELSQEDIDELYEILKQNEGK